MTYDETDKLIEKGLEKAFRDLYAKAAKEGIALVTMDEDGNIVEKIPELEINPTPSCRT